MSRALIDYTARTARTAPAAGFDPDTPIAGTYRMKLRSGAVWVGIRIEFGPPLDPVDGSVLDRSHRWIATANGRPIDIERVWPRCAEDPIDAKECQFLADTEAWAKANAPTSPQANPTRRIDLATAPLPELF